MWTGFLHLPGGAQNLAAHFFRTVQLGRLAVSTITISVFCTLYTGKAADGRAPQETILLFKWKKKNHFAVQTICRTVRTDRASGIKNIPKPRRPERTRISVSDSQFASICIYFSISCLFTISLVLFIYILCPNLADKCWERFEDENHLCQPAFFWHIHACQLELPWALGVLKDSV